MLCSLWGSQGLIKNINWCRAYKCWTAGVPHQKYPVVSRLWVPKHRLYESQVINVLWIYSLWHVQDISVVCRNVLTGLAMAKDLMSATTTTTTINLLYRILFAGLIKPSWSSDIWVWMLVLLGGKPQCAALELLFRTEWRTMSSSQLVRHMESQRVPNKADRWYCPLYLQKSINPHSLLPWWILFGLVSAAHRDKG